jgi:Flp pilus assembly protein TadB
VRSGRSPADHRRASWKQGRLRTAYKVSSGLGVLLFIVLVLLVVKWALIAAAVLVVPLGIWWIWNRRRPRER